jgi:hypothetical protein
MIRNLKLAASIGAICLPTVFLAGCGGGGDAPDTPSAEQRRPPPSETRRAPGPGNTGGMAADDTQSQPGTN